MTQSSPTRRSSDRPQVQGERAWSQTDQLQAALALLESIVADRNGLADLPADERTRLLQAVALVHHPEPRARRREAKAQARERAQEKARQTEELLNQTGIRRSEEHTSELQSLMRISYAVFCSKKKNRKSCPDKQPPHPSQTIGAT